MPSGKKMEESSRKINDEYSSDEYEAWNEEKKLKRGNHITLAYKMKCVKMAKAHPGWSLKTLQGQGCKLLQRMSWLPRWERECETGGNSFDKYAVINEWTLANVVRARKRNLQVKGRHIRQWALAVAAQYPDLRFGASSQWLKSFKEKYHMELRPTQSSLDSKIAEQPPTKKA